MDLFIRVILFFCTCRRVACQSLPVGDPSRSLGLQLSAPSLESMLLSMEIHSGQMFLANHWTVVDLEGGVSARV